MQLQTMLCYSYCLWHDLYNIVFKIKHNITTWSTPTPLMLSWKILGAHQQRPFNQACSIANFRQEFQTAYNNPPWSGWGQGQVAGICEFGNEPLGSMKCGEYLDKLLTRCPDCGGVEGRHVQHLLLTCGNVIWGNVRLLIVPCGWFGFQ